MGFAGPAGSASETKNKTLTLNQQITASDQAAVDARRHSGNVKDSGNVKVGKGGTYSPTTDDRDIANTYVYGLGAEDVIKAQSNLVTALQGSLPKGEAPALPAPAPAPIEGRIASQTTAGGTEAKEQIKGALPRSAWIAIVGGVALLLLVIFFRRKKG